MVLLKRVSEPASARDGQRVLVERLWPRGIRKKDLVIDGWLKDLAPSTELRKWFGHDPARWDEFVRRYRHELKQPTTARLLAELTHHAARHTVTLVYSTHDTEHNNAVVLRDAIERALSRAHDSGRHHSPMP
jgi:uncharacterized protein YeaO (DUF488 family)